MAISSNHYPQFHDYLKQLMELSGKKEVPKFTQKDVGERLKVDPSGVSKFLSHTVEKPKKMLTNFIATYPVEFQRWPAGLEKINRVLQKADAFYFLGIVTIARPIVPPSPERPTRSQSVVVPPVPPLPPAAPAATVVATVLPAGRALVFPVGPADGFVLALPPAPPAVGSTETTLLPVGRALVFPPGPVNAFVLAPPPTGFQVPQDPVVPSVPALPPAGRVDVAPPPAVLPPVVAPAPAPPRQPRVMPNPEIDDAPIAISYRGHIHEKDGPGMLFDHMRFQYLTRIETVTLLPENQVAATGATNLFTIALRGHIAPLFFGEPDRDLKLIPRSVQECAALGLLIIPGRPNIPENSATRLRMAHEFKAIRGALNRGQPVLGICAGAWRVWEMMFLWSRHPDKLNDSPERLVAWLDDRNVIVDVADHVNNNGMVRLDILGMRATHNTMIHDIIIQQGSMLRAAMEDGDDRIAVNSVHWRAANPEQSPENVVISAVAKRTVGSTRHTRTGRLMEPEEDTVEAFEHDKGAPTFGIQWHPEGDNGDTENTRLINYMALAGGAYRAKRVTLAQLLERPQ